MPSPTWTPDALSSEAASTSGSCWRVVEAQHRVSTTRLTDSVAEQDRLEAIIEEAKPKIPEECRHLHYLLFTPFRYGAPYPRGSRFRRAGFSPGIFYASETPETALAETAFARLLFFAESPSTPWPTTAAQLSAFRVEIATRRAIDLSRAPFRTMRALWMHLTDYEACQQLCENARRVDIDIIRYESVRDPNGGKNLAVLSCRAFRTTQPARMQTSRMQTSRMQTWRMHLSATGVRVLGEFPQRVLAFGTDTFGADPRIAALRWER